MKDQNGTKKQLIDELMGLRKRVNQLEKLESKHKRAEEEIRALEQQIEFILGVTHTGLDIIDSDFNIRYIDPEWAKVYGVSTGKKCYEYFMGRNTSCPECGIIEALKTKKPIVTEEVLVKENNRPIQVTTIPFQNEKGEWMVAEVNVDISERKRAEEALRKAYAELETRIQKRTGELVQTNEAMQAEITERKRVEEALRTEKERLQTLLENAPFGMVMIDHDGTFRYINPKFRELFGYDLDDVSNGKTWFRKAFPDSTYRHDVISAWVEDLEIFKPGEKRSKTFTVTCKGGTKKIINFIPVQLGTGENLMTFEDITERKRAEEALRESEAKYRQLVEHAPVGIYEIDLVQLKFLSVNDVMCEIMGYTREEFLSMSALMFIVEEGGGRGKNLLIERTMKMMSGEKVSESAEYKIKTKDGREIWILVNIKLIYEDGRPVKVQVVAQDITERKILEEQLLQSQRIEAVGRLAGGIAHDFNNLLTVISGNCQLSLFELREGDPLKGNIEEIKRAADRAASLIRQLLAFSRRQILQFNVIDLNTILRDLEKMLRRVIGEDIELVTTLAKDLGKVKTDYGQIEQVIVNLVVNGKDAMPDGGKLIIETANMELDEKVTPAYVGMERGRYVRLSVTDTGVGMPPEVQEHIFEPFFTMKEKGKGTGLGLSTVYGIVKQSEGYIYVHSELGHGTTFDVLLPQVNEPVEVLGEKVEGKEVSRGKETILLVEDEEAVLKLTMQFLKKQGYWVLEASLGGDALLICKKHQGPIHLMITDVVMPGMNGRELAENLLVLRPEMKVLYMSGYTDNKIVHHGVIEEGVNYIQKPFTLEGLVRKVREVLDQ